MKKIKIIQYINNSNVSRFRTIIQIAAFILFVYGGYFFINITRWVQLNYLYFNIIDWSFKNKFINELHQS